VGWGRFPRIFWKDIKASNLYGCDVDPDALALCRKTGVPGTFDRLYPRGKLPYPDGHFGGGIAYSVFTHLSEDAHTHWMLEIARVMRPGAVFCLTLEPRRFAEFIEQLPQKPLTDWHTGLKRFAGEGNRLRAEFDAGQLAYLPTGGGMHRQASEYGDAIVPPAFMEREWGHAFALRAYIDEPSRYWQAVAVMQRT
jgi:SAM-dependent methyltransferase